MKYLTFSTLLFCLFSPLAAQNEPQASAYQLFRPGVQYLYDNPYLSVEFYSPIVGMKLDSSRRDAHGRYTLYESPEMDHELFCINFGPSFAGTSLSYTDSTTVLYFSDTLTGAKLLIRQRELPGARWEAASGITAEVISLENGDFSGITDSVKTIRFMDASTGALLGNDIRISKKHGLWTSTWFARLREESRPLELLSTSSPHLGPQLPAVADIFNIPVGTELSTSTTEAQVEESPFFWYYETFNRNITVQSVLTDSTAGTLTIHYTYDVNYFRRAPEFYGDSIFAASRTNGLSDSWEFELDYLAAMKAQPGAATFWGQDSSCLLFVTAGYPANECFGIGRGADYLACLSFQDDTCFEPLLDIGSSGLYFHYAGGGYGELGTFRPLSETLHRVKNAFVDCGNPFDLTVADRQERDDRRIQVFPNPASGRVMLDVPTDLGALSYRVYNAQGQLLQSGAPQPGNRSLDLTAFPAGVYTVAISQPNGLTVQRRLILR